MWTEAIDRVAASIPFVFSFGLSLVWICGFKLGLRSLEFEKVQLLSPLGLRG